MTTLQSEPLAEILRTIYLARKSGALELERSSGGQEILFFRDGELFIHPSHPATPLVEPHAGEVAGSRPAGVPEIQRAMATMAREWVQGKVTVAGFREEQAVSAGLIGPLPTILLAMDVATLAASEKELLARLGGKDQRYQANQKTPALHQLPGLEPDMAEALTTLVQPASVRELLSGAGSDELALLRSLVRLRATGLIEELGGRSTPPDEDDILSPRLLGHFIDRVGDDLAHEGLDLDSATHRDRLAELLASLGGRNHYELLGVGLRATEEDILDAYNRLARIVHPSHAASLGLEGREETIRVLFERATEAYLVLSDPRRRASYNTIVGLQLKTEVEASQRTEEKRRLARQNYRRALQCLSEMDYSLAIDLLKEAARMDPKAEYFSRLGSVQAKNPNWFRHSLESYRRAVELSPQDAGIRTGFAEALESMELLGEAKKQFKEALRLMPDHVTAREGLDRLRKF